LAHVWRIFTILRVEKFAFLRRDCALSPSKRDDGLIGNVQSGRCSKRLYAAKIYKDRRLDEGIKGSMSAVDQAEINFTRTSRIDNAPANRSSLVLSLFTFPQKGRIKVDGSIEAYSRAEFPRESFEGNAPPEMGEDPVNSRPFGNPVAQRRPARPARVRPRPGI